MNSGVRACFPRQSSTMEFVFTPINCNWAPRLARLRHIDLGNAKPLTLLQAQIDGGAPACAPNPT
jgi:hypothetical protein